MSNSWPSGSGYAISEARAEPARDFDDPSDLTPGKDTRQSFGQPDAISNLGSAGICGAV